MIIGRRLCLIFCSLTISFSWSLAQSDSLYIDSIHSDTVAPSALAYHVGANDVLFIKVFGNEDLSGDFRVSHNGSIVYPLIGQLVVANLDVSQVQDSIYRRLKKDYLQNPIVSVEVKLFLSQAVYVLGNVGKPGSYNLTKPTQLFDLLSLAEGLTPAIDGFGKQHEVHILRQNEQYLGTNSTLKDTLLIINVDQLLIEGNAELNIYIQSGDVIYIPSAMSFHILGEVKSPGTFPFREGLTILEAVSMAGGKTNAASAKRVYTTRIDHTDEQKTRVKMTEIIQPNDIIEVPQSIW